MKQTGASEENIQLFLQFLGSQANLFYVFLQHNRQSLLTTNLAGILEIDHEQAQKVADAILSLELTPTSSDDANRIVKDLTTALCGMDDAKLSDKCHVFLKAFRDIRVCSRIAELDSRPLFNALCRKLIYYLKHEAKEMQTLLLMVLVRLLQRSMHHLFISLY